MIRSIGHCLTWLGWLLAIVSLFLPASNALQSAGSLPGTPLLGWEALTTLIENTLNVWFWLYCLAEPAAQWLVVLVVATVLLLALPPVVTLADDRAGSVQVLLGVTPTALFLLPAHIQSSLFWGVWVWTAAFLLVALGGLIRWWTAMSDALHADCPRID